MAIYITTQRDNRYWFVGPFDSHEAAGEWNKQEANNPSDDPRWQTIALDNPYAQPAVLSPSEASLRATENST